jgi:very-short-patch-repair endonuclease
MDAEHRKARYREYARKRREKLNYFIDIKCLLCENIIQTKKYNEAYAKRKGLRCKQCLSKMSSRTLKELRSRQTAEEKSAAAKLARSKVKNSSESVKKQWNTIKSKSQEDYAQFIDSRSKRMKKVWDTVYTDEQKDKIVGALVSANNCGRSKLSENFKQELINNKLYDGFESEQPFHGFIPDEINHSLKLIIEVYGDVYHCNPKQYSDDTEYVPVIQRTVGQQRQRDKIRLAAFYKHGYTTIIVWENDIYRELDNQIKRIKDAIDEKRNIAGIL